MTAEDFDAYDAIVLGDRTCAGLEPEAASTAHADMWSSVVDGNVVMIGADANRLTTAPTRLDRGLTQQLARPEGAG